MERAELGSIINASRFGDDIYFGGQLQPGDLALLREKGVKTVVNLRRPQEMEQLGFDEGQILQEAGMEYHLIPFGHELPPDEQAYGQLADLLDDPRKHPLLLHCASSNRVGYAWALFRAKQHHLGLSAAVNEGKSAGMRSPRFEAHLHNLLLPKPDDRDDR